MKNWIRWATAAVLLGLSACTSKNEMAKHQFREYKVDQDLAGIVVPRSIWPVVDGRPPAKQNGAEQQQAAKLVELKPLRVWFVEQDPGVLGAANHRFEFGPGGGTIDLSDLVVEGARGGFSLGAEFEKTNPSVLSRSVLFVSNSRRRESRGQILGSGCRSIFDITSYFEAEMEKQGLLLTTEGNSHASSLAGMFVFVARTAETDLVAQLTVRDSRTRFLQCRP
jgi:hypothetical protein